MFINKAKKLGLDDPNEQFFFQIIQTKKIQILFYNQLLTQNIVNTCTKKGFVDNSVEKFSMQKGSIITKGTDRIY